MSDWPYLTGTGIDSWIAHPCLACSQNLVSSDIALERSATGSTSLRYSMPLINVLPANSVVGQVDVRAAVVRGLDLFGLEEEDMPVGEEIVSGA